MKNLLLVELQLLLLLPPLLPLPLLLPRQIKWAIIAKA